MVSKCKYEYERQFKYEWQYGQIQAMKYEYMNTKVQTWKYKYN